MKHVIAIGHARAKEHDCSLLPTFSSTYFADAGDENLQERFDKHLQEYSSQTNKLGEDLLKVQPNACNKIGVAKDIGIAIFRDWVINNVKGCSHGGLLQLHNKTYDVSHIMSIWSSKDWHRDVGICFGHVHRAVEGCFGEAEHRLNYVFRRKDTAIGDTLSMQSSRGNFMQYFAILSFDTTYNGKPY